VFLTNATSEKVCADSEKTTNLSNSLKCTTTHFVS